jgi:hypothetical protein
VCRAGPHAPSEAYTLILPLHGFAKPSSVESDVGATSQIMAPGPPRGSAQWPCQPHNARFCIFRADPPHPNAYHHGASFRASLNFVLQHCVCASLINLCSSYVVSAATTITPHLPYSWIYTVRDLHMPDLVRTPAPQCHQYAMSGGVLPFIITRKFAVTANPSLTCLLDKPATWQFITFAEFGKRKRSNIYKHIISSTTSILCSPLKTPVKIYKP